MSNTKTRRASRCIFCKKSSVDSKSVEHIIPQSLGNHDHTLPVGVVCDNCNNYFARKIEGPLLSSSYFKNLRARQGVPNKKGRVPPWGTLLGADCQVTLNFYNGTKYIAPYNEEDRPKFDRYMKKRKERGYVLPASSEPLDKYLLSRFIAKVAVEILAHRLLEHEGWEKDVTDHSQLDLLRNYARYGSGVENWPVYEREIYTEDYIFEDGGQTIHEFDLLWPDRKELYAVVCIFGTEYTINMGGPELEGYEAWLKKNSYASPLYVGKNRLMYGMIK